MRNLLDAHFVAVIGKGGVGKSTVSAALALAAAQAGRRVLVAMCNARERLSYLLEVEPIGHENQPVLPGIEAVNMTPDAALEEYGMMMLKLRALYRAVFENRLVSAFLKGTPGLDAWAMLGKAAFHAVEQDARGVRRYDQVILDAPATGHGLEMFRVPRVILEVASPGVLRSEAQNAWNLFSDPARSAVCLVALPEDMPTNESLELYTSIRNELGLPVSHLVINRVLPQLFDPTLREQLERVARELDPGAPLRSMLTVARTRARWESLQRDCIERLCTAIAAKQIQLPNLFARELRRPEVRQLSETLSTQL